jgi:hypothetical protein
LASLATLRETILGAPRGKRSSRRISRQAQRRALECGPAMIYKYERRRKHRVKVLPSERFLHTNGAHGESEKHPARTGKAAH